MNWWHSLLLLSEHTGNAKDAPIHQKSPLGASNFQWMGPLMVGAASRRDNRG